MMYAMATSTEDDARGERVMQVMADRKRRREEQERATKHGSMRQPVSAVVQGVPPSSVEEGTSYSAGMDFRKPPGSIDESSSSSSECSSDRRERKREKKEKKDRKKREKKERKKEKKMRRRERKSEKHSRRGDRDPS